MKRCKIELNGKCLGLFRVHWTVVRSLTEKDVAYAEWVRAWLNGQEVKVGSVLTGILTVSIGA